MKTADAILASPCLTSPSAFKSRLGYRPALDGIRGICVIVVLAVHAGFFERPAAAFIGVDIFFVLSGFLITNLLVEEWDRFKSISLKRFYFRRALRLLPALLLLMIMVLAFEWIATSRDVLLGDASDALMALLYISNWVRITGFYLAGIYSHTWSLSIEEQFYLFWPLLLIFLLKRTTSRRSLLSWIFLGFMIAVFYRIFIFCWGTTWYRIARGTDTRADSLLIGCVVGVLFASGLLPHQGWVKQLIKVSAYLAVPILFGLGCYENIPQNLDFFIVYPTVSLLAAIIILELLLAEIGYLNWILSRSWLVYVGKISYGLYVWHYPIFQLIRRERLSHGKELAFEIALSIVATLLSFYLVERPILSRKNAFSWRKPAIALPLPLSG